ncbi:MAG: archease [Candidatus Iainarchaeum archaeon]|uniref:Archease n=1 Tax=Candidatus Iainarchaeum sp. TaxID=3101447 RepID=A0A497JH85_9ARCH|nr:MAG: archease [Candidatus Diapherotrites archaeon]
MYETFPHKADIGIRAKAETIGKAFCEAAKALFSVMVDLENVEAKEIIKISVSAEALDLLFVEWLNALISEAALRNMLFSEFEVKILKNDLYKLEGKAKGEKINLDKHNIKTEVKAATYSALKVEKNSVWLVQCILDV